MQKGSGLPLNPGRTEPDGRPMAERAGNCSEGDFGSMGADTAHTGPVRVVQVMRKCSVVEQGRFPDAQRWP